MIEKIIDFVLKDDQGEPIVDLEGLPIIVQRPKPTNLSEVVSTGDIDDINKSAQLVSDLEQWLWAESYILWMIDSKSGGTMEEPVRPTIKTTDEVLEPYQVMLFKMSRQKLLDDAKVTISTGKSFDADEVSIGRLANAILMSMNEGDDFIIPWSTADVNTGVMVNCTRKEIIEAHSEAVINMANVWERAE